MCGITGIYAHNLVGSFHMINMAKSTEKLGHRGPDAQGAFNNTHVGLGHRRLSVIDTSYESNQPMADSSGRYQLVFNGEIYNYKELKEDLLSQGKTFKTESDTEVLLYHLVEYGKGGISKLNGFFSFAFYDSVEDSLLLCIDRFGIKPLYYLKDDNKLIFSSEMGSLLEYGVEKNIDKTALLLYFQLNYIPAPFTILQGVKKLEPGTLIFIKGLDFQLEQWYNPEINEIDIDYKDATKKLRELLDNSVKKRLVSDVPIGSFLSGGLDSSIISLLAKKHKADLKTFSIGFEDEKFFDEQEFSRITAQSINSDHTVFNLGFHDFQDNLKSILDSFSEPFADSSAIAYSILSKKTKQEVTVSLSGDGADELFGGYNKHQAFLKSFDKGLTETLASTFSPFMQLLPTSRSGKLTNYFRQIKRFGKGANLPLNERYWYWASLNTLKQSEKLFKNDFIDSDSLNRMIQWRKQSLDSCLTQNSMNSVLRADQALVLPNDMLVKADRMSMAHGLEVRVPFLDHTIVEFVNSLPSHYKVEKGKGKKILRDAFPEIPIEILSRSKKGFEVPLAKWLRKSLCDKQVRDYFDFDFLLKLVIFNLKSVARLEKKTPFQQSRRCSCPNLGLPCFSTLVYEIYVKCSPKKSS